MVLLHSNSINLARRLSNKNEPDFLQENMLESKMSRLSCQRLASKISSVSDMPVDCKNYDDLMQDLQRRLTKSDAGAFAGMTPAQAQAAMSARAKGQLNPAQLQRRFTQTRTFKKE